jgi:hypothetical protein
MTSDKDGAPADLPVLRNANGSLRKGTGSINPLGMDRRSAAIVRLLEGATPKAIRTLVKLLDDPNPMAQLGAAKEIISRVAPAPPRRKAETTVNVAITSPSDDSRAIAVARARMRAEGIDPNLYLPRPGAQPMLAGPEIIDVTATEVEAEPAAEEDDDVAPI